MNPTDTHSYDGNLNIELLPDLVYIKELGIEEKRGRGKEIRDIVGNLFDPEAIKYLEGIIDSIGTEENIDRTNGLVADDLLCLCWCYRDNSNFLIELETQLLDMRTGFCPQGRTHRLFQTLMAFSGVTI